MIEHQKIEEKNKILDLCLLTHPVKEHVFLNTYFDQLSKDDLGLLIKEDQKLVSCMQMKEHSIKFKDKILLSSYIFGVATHIDYRQKGYMDKLMNMMLDRSSKNYLITFVEAYNPKLYKKYGFETISSRKKLTIAQRELKVNNTKGVVGDVSAEELVSLYEEFSSHFDCHYIRDVTYYENYMDMVEKNGGHIIGFQNKLGKLIGYCTFYVREDLVEVSEVIYFDALTLYKLLRYAIGKRAYLSLEVSSNERVEKLFKHSIPRENTCVMARINNYSLFNKLYDTDVKTISEVLKILKHPVLINEKN